VTKHQTIAYRSPCFRAEETTHLKFLWWLRQSRRPISVLLTANIGLE